MDATPKITLLEVKESPANLSSEITDQGKAFNLLDYEF